MGRALLSKVLIQLSADERGSTSSLVVVWPEVTQRWDLWLYGRVNGDPQEGLQQGGPSWPDDACAPVPVVTPADPGKQRISVERKTIFFPNLR